MSIDPELLEILVCPQDKRELSYDEQADLLVNPRLGVAYRVDEGIPVLLAEEAVTYPASDESVGHRHDG